MNGNMEKRTNRKRTTTKKTQINLLLLKRCNFPVSAQIKVRPFLKYSFIDGTHWFANGRFEVWKTSHLFAFFEL